MFSLPTLLRHDASRPASRRALRSTVIIAAAAALLGTALPGTGLPAQRPVADPPGYVPAPTAAPSTAQPGQLTQQQSRLMARRAAIADAQRQLLEMIYGVRIDSETLVRDFVTERDEIRTSLQGRLRGAQVVETRYLDDGVVEVDMVVDLNTVEGALGIGLPAYGGHEFFVTGTGAPNVEPTYPPPPPDQPLPPDYNFRNVVVEAQGNGVEPRGREHTPQGFAMARRAATLDAYRNLGEAIRGVRIDSDTFVRDFVTERDDIRSRFEGFVRGAQVVDTQREPDGLVTVTMRITLNELGDIILVGQRQAPPPQSRDTGPTIDRRSPQQPMQGTPRPLTPEERMRAGAGSSGG